MLKKCKKLTFFIFLVFYADLFLFFEFYILFIRFIVIDYNDHFKIMVIFFGWRMISQMSLNILFINMLLIKTESWVRLLILSIHNDNWLFGDGSDKNAALRWLILQQYSVVFLSDYGWLPVVRRGDDAFFYRNLISGEFT